MRGRNCRLTRACERNLLIPRPRRRGGAVAEGRGRSGRTRPGPGRRSVELGVLSNERIRGRDRSSWKPGVARAQNDAPASSGSFPPLIYPSDKLKVTRLNRSFTPDGFLSIPATETNFHPAPAGERQPASEC